MTDADDTYPFLRDGRLRLADYLDALGPEAWEQPSLCDGWTVTDVVAHVSLSTTGTWWDMVVGMVRHRGNWDRWNATSARHQAEARSPNELVALIRRDADSRAHAAGSSPADQLVDLLVHGQDIARAIDTPLDVPTEPAVVAIEHALASRWYGAKKRFVGIRLEATDGDWSTAGGDKIARGPMASLLLVATGRPAGLTDLEGPGADTVRQRFR